MWISVKYKSFPDGVNFLVTDGNKIAHVSVSQKEDWDDWPDDKMSFSMIPDCEIAFDHDEITHWFILPELPKEQL